MSASVLADKRSGFASARRIVVKIGSALLTDPHKGIALDDITDWCNQINGLLGAGRQVVLVSSGAVAEGVARLGLGKRPETLHELQAVAAVGQMGLVQAYERAFSRHQRHTGMVLLTHDDFANRQRYLNARSTLTTLLRLGVVPIINENDSVATDEIRFGDNDTLAALVTNLMQADLLIILTDVDGVFEKDPRSNPGASPIAACDVSDPRLDQVSGATAGAFGRGGMLTKISAARTAATSGANTVIANGRTPDVLTRITQGDEIGSLLVASVSPLVGRKQWIRNQQRSKGELRLDAGAVSALQRKGVSLLPVGVVSVSGEFKRGDLVRCTDAQGRTVAQGLVNYSSVEAAKLTGCASDQIATRLGYAAEPEMVHRDNLVLLS
ncbi:MAG: glutamate 5-kinase [Proteobacteria bacterium]|nr:glutamate 5-kinase [Pseudomonadota bacterium]